MIREKIQIFHQFLSTDAKKSLSGTLRSAVLLCVLALMPVTKAHAVVEKAAIYEGDTLLWRCMQLWTAGVHDDTPYRLNLRVIKPTSESSTVQICNGDTLLWRCQEVWESGYYYDTVRSLEFPYMDSVCYQLQLVVNEIVPEEESATIFIGDTLLWRCM